MLAIREIVTRDIFTGYEVPEEFGDEFEMILVPINNRIKNEEEEKIKMKHQEENGFSKNILAQESEDVWNDI
ncbi:MAG: hypothetical protein Q9M40_12140 [Sulfurimonas sp.]|nr:hypothetical protein [Sulfurimonas sp.]